MRMSPKPESEATAIIATAAANASSAANAAAQAASSAANNASIAAKSAADSAVAIAGVARDTDWMKKALERMEGTLDSMNKAFVTAAQHADVLKSIDDHENRLTNLETEKTRITLLLSVSAFMLSSLIGLLVYHILGGK